MAVRSGIERAITVRANGANSHLFFARLADFANVARLVLRSSCWLDFREKKVFFLGSRRGRVFRRVAGR
jgi:hypothetical protein